MDFWSFRSAILIVSHGKQTPGPNSFISIQFLAKILPNNKILPQTQELLPPRLENPGSVTELCCSATSTSNENAFRSMTSTLTHQAWRALFGSCWCAGSHSRFPLHSAWLWTSASGTGNRKRKRMLEIEIMKLWKLKSWNFWFDGWPKVTDIEHSKELHSQHNSTFQDTCNSTACVNDQPFSFWCYSCDLSSL